MDIEYSVIVPVYNVRQYLAQCLDSILAQSCGENNSFYAAAFGK